MVRAAQISSPNSPTGRRLRISRARQIHWLQVRAALLLRSFTSRLRSSSSASLSSRLMAWERLRPRKVAPSTRQAAMRIVPLTSKPVQMLVASMARPMAVRKSPQPKLLLL